MTYRVLIPDSLDPSALALLAEAGMAVIAVERMPRHEVLSAIAEADALIVRSATRVDAELLTAASRLRLVVRAGVGVDNVDLAEATRRGVVVMNTPEGNTTATAEHTLALMLALARHIPAAHASLGAGHWERKAFMGVELRGKTLGIIGFGRVGQAVARRAAAFGMRILACDPKRTPRMEQTIAEVGGQLVDLDTLLAQADFISLHATLNAETQGMINARTLARMKRGVRIINTARGALIVEADLAEAIRSGQVAGAAVDVYAEEPPAADHPLLGLPTVIHTPHLAASTFEAQAAVAIEATQLVMDALLRGEYRNVVNPEVLAGHRA